jgi:hypothetical protein
MSIEDNAVLIDSVYKLYVFDKATGSLLNEFTVIAKMETEAVKKSGLKYDNKIHRVFIRASGYELTPSAIEAGLIEYAGTPTDAKVVDIVGKILVLEAK